MYPKILFLYLFPCFFFDKQYDIGIQVNINVIDINYKLGFVIILFAILLNLKPYSLD